MTSMGTEGNRPTNDDLPTQNLPWKNLWAWFLVIFFAGTQILFFSLLAWLPAMYVNLGWSQQQAGLVLAVFMIAELCGSLGSTAITRSYRDRRLPLGIMLTLSSVGIAGGTFYPLVIPWGWATVMGLGVGGTFALVLTLPVDYTFSPTATDQLTALMFGPGYIIAAAGPFVTGEIRSVTGSFQEAYLLLTGISLTLLFATGLLHPDRQILS
jgi:CP family cyanate transporter-like MFS transporter